MVLGPALNSESAVRKRRVLLELRLGNQNQDIEQEKHKYLGWHGLQFQKEVII